MNRWSARRSPGIWMIWLLILAAWALAAWAVDQLAMQFVGAPRDWPITWRSWGLLIAALAGFMLGGVLLYQTLSAWTLHYRIDRNALTIHWLGNRWIVPMNRITSVDVGIHPARMPWMSTRWLGYRRGIGQTDQRQPLYMWTTLPLAKSVVIRTQDSVYALSPANRDGFIQDVEERRGLGVVQGQTEGIVHTRRLSYPFWTDATVRGLLLLLLGLHLALWAVISWRYVALPEMIALRFSAAGDVLDLVPREQLLVLPLVGILVMLANTVVGVWLYGASRAGALLLLIGAAVVQLLLAVALLGPMLAI